MVFDSSQALSDRPTVAGTSNLNSHQCLLAAFSCDVRMPSLNHLPRIPHSYTLKRAADEMYMRLKSLGFPYSGYVYQLMRMASWIHCMCPCCPVISFI